MFDEQEIEALVLGARIVRSWADAELAEAAANVIVKVETMELTVLMETFESETGKTIQDFLNRNTE